jgi:hypothetical protein
LNVELKGWTERIVEEVIEKDDLDHLWSML